MTIASILATVLLALARAAAPSAPTLGDPCAFPAGWAPPFTHVYHLRNGGTVVFVGIEHSYDPNDAWHRAIAAAFDRYKPDFVLVEGAASSQGDIPAAVKFLTDRANSQAKAGAIQENLSAVALASARNVPFSGWDLSPVEDYANGIRDHFTITDIAGTHLIHSRVDPSALSSQDHAVGRELARASRVQPLAAFDYPAWYGGNYGATFDVAHATPCDAGIAARIAADESRHRNLNLIAAISKHALPGKVLLVEAGANHWLALRRYLESIATGAG